MKKCLFAVLLVSAATSLSYAQQQDQQQYIELQPVPQQQYQQQQNSSADGRSNTVTVIPAAAEAPKQPAVVQEQPVPSADKRRPVNAAENVAGRFALGFQMTSNMNVLSNDIPSLSARYWVNDEVGIEGIAGFTTGDSEDSFILGAKALGILKSYNSLNIYVSALIAAGTANFKSPGGSGVNTMFKAAAGVGVEWFVLDNLSLSTEIGFGFFNCTNVSKQFGFYADWLPQAGVRYYL